MAKLTLDEWIARLKKNKSFNHNAAAVVEIPAKAGDWEEYPAWVNPHLRAVLEKRGYAKLYSHQAQAIRFVRNSQDVVLVTPTASGKTLCYNLPVLQSILDEPETRALYLFPTKALAQ
ncbi:MAG: DEAD/DEAH box helicase, partial [Syntrophomonas sp.]